MQQQEILDLWQEAGMPRGFSAEEMMDLLDADSDGELTKDEFLKSFLRMIYNDPFQQQCLQTSKLHCVARHAMEQAAKGKKVQESGCIPCR